MSLLSELIDLPGVVAAGDYAYRGDQFDYVGEISFDEARMLSVLCRANTESVYMESDMLATFAKVCQPGGRGCGFERAKGWIVNGCERSICVISNTFCIYNNEEASIDKILGLMRKRLADAPDVLV